MPASSELPHELRLSISKLARRLRAEKADRDVSDSQFSVLAGLVKNGDRTIGELSEGERVTPPSMNRTVNALEAAGYVRRGASPDDGRKVVVSATDAGRTMVVETKRRRDAWFTERLAALSAEQRAALEAAAPVIRELADR